MTFEGLLFSALCGTIAAFPLLGNAVFLFLSFQRAAVGYQNIEGKTGFTQITPSFAGIGADYSIQDAKLVGAMGFGGESLQFVDADGNSPESYTWFDAAIMGVTGWYGSDYQMSTREFDPAESFLIGNDAGGFSINVAGQVAFDGIEALEGLAGFTSVGNMTPVVKGIQKFTLTGAMGYGGESLQFIDADGNSPESYTWFDAAIMGVTGWYGSDYQMSTRDIGAAEGFLIGNDAGNYTISIPGVND